MVYKVDSVQLEYFPSQFRKQMSEGYFSGGGGSD